MSTIKLTCQTCKYVWDLERTKEIHADVKEMESNWCILCEDQAEDVYDEWYIYEESDPPFINPNQLKLFN